MYLDFELGTIDLAADDKFFDSLTFGFMWATVIVGILCIVFTRYIAMIAYIPYKYYFPLLVVFIVWACVQYTGGWEDYAVLAIMTVIGLLAKKYKFSRPAMLMAFILSDRVEALTIQMTRLYNIDRLLDRPIFLVLVALIVIVFVWGILRRGKLEYA
jgi:TctA family transporter